MRAPPSQRDPAGTPNISQLRYSPCRPRYAPQHSAAGNGDEEDHRELAVLEGFWGEECPKEQREERETDGTKADAGSRRS